MIRSLKNIGLAVSAVYFFLTPTMIIGAGLTTGNSILLASSVFLFVSYGLLFYGFKKDYQTFLPIISIFHIPFVHTFLFTQAIQEEITSYEVPIFLSVPVALYIIGYLLNFIKK